MSPLNSTKITIVSPLLPLSSQTSVNTQKLNKTIKDPIPLLQDPPFQPTQSIPLNNEHSINSTINITKTLTKLSIDNQIPIEPIEPNHASIPEPNHASIPEPNHIPMNENYFSQPFPPTCHGKVKDLEIMVPQNWWKTLFADNMYLKTDGDVVEDPAITTEEINVLNQDKHLHQLFQKRNVPVLDLCCGQGRHSIALKKQFNHLEMYGLDQSSYLISLAKSRALNQNVECTFVVGDCRVLPYPDSFFEVVMVMGNSFGYFANDSGDLTVLNEIYRVVKANGMVLIDITDGQYMKEHFNPRSWEWLDDLTFACRERQLSKDGLRLVSREVITDTTKGVIRDQFYQERLYSRSQLMNILSDCGFTMSFVQDEETEVSCITAAKELSLRQQDLGMMEQRILVKAFKESHDSAVSVDSNLSVSVSLPFENIIVLLGDPSKPCTGKLNNSWNKEDIETRNRLLTALYEIGYSSETLKVLSNHDSMLLDIMNHSTKTVFNLCDEGFGNDALKELHVPALLEMLNINYTGAGPSCLSLCYDKGLVTRTAQSIGIHTPNETFYLGELNNSKITDLSDLDSVHCVIEQSIHYPVFLKPLKGDNSLGITSQSIVSNKCELSLYMKTLEQLGIRNIIIQEYLAGAEYGVGMIGNLNQGFKFLPIIRVDFQKIIERNLAPILGYESKWEPTSPYWTDISYKEAILSPQVREKLEESCILLWERFGCRDYARFDFRCDVGMGDGYDGLNGSIKLLEVNPNPGWCWDGKFTYMAKLAGIEYPTLLKMVLEAAAKRLK